ncbi:methyl-accepting chemotaxis protein [Rhizobium sp. C1]|uniref:methyl-accepting chemotaxis protein n=1 Tax=Rhizobium sp. C1 TaxID=1349799 RepID=UPI001E394CCB|nr:HAMP domain-containing methyl-accepting chemotaxis protein [Rhizobium sp. C1]MCD2180226.1 methyl-accepting chemotaxis protein [Rhizobium sp. C1]
MNIDGLLSRFRIQTKIFLMVTPFVLSILLVGFVSLYSNEILRGRIEISNVVLQSMNGYKQVFASISGFLREPVRAKFDKAAEDVAQQKARLAEVVATLQGQTDVSLLDQALTQTDKIAENNNGLWKLEQQRTGVLADIAQNFKSMDDVQNAASKTVFKLVADATRIQNAQKAELKASVDIDSQGRKLSDLLSKLNNSADANERLAAIDAVRADPDLNRLAGSLPADKKELAVTLNATLKKLKEDNQAGEGAASTAGADLLFLSAQMNKMASDMMHKAVIELTNADKGITLANSMNRKIAALMTARSNIEIGIAKLTAAPTKEQLATTQSDIYLFGKTLDDIGATAPDDASFKAMADGIKPVLDKFSDSAAALLDIFNRKNTEFSAAATQIDQTWSLLSQFADQQKDQAKAESMSANSISISVVVAGIIIAILAGIGLILIFRRPIGQITSAMRRLAEGVLDTSIQGDNRRDEIGDMARALGIFKANALEKLRVENVSEEQRLAAEAERRRNDAEKQASQEQIDFAVRQLAQSLRQLSDGDLTCAISTPFSGGLDQLRQDFNGSLERLNETLAQIRQDARNIQANGNAMRASADELSRRTETQAASLEQTAAAVDEITVTVRQTASRAGEANTIVRDTRKNAEASSEIVADAVDAMTRIEEASRKIEQIIDVIEDIAFQTNLLALNAGIEAARAGEAGKGFAVVAQEVRELAQRSAGAANEIKSLIDTATHEVTTGVRHVQRTGEALSDISTRIAQLYEHVQMIAQAAHDQSAGLQEVNTAVNQMDQMTQANAAMVEEANAVSQQLAHEGDHLMQLISQFRLKQEQRQAYAA